ncbi:MAG: hypothetical protein WBL55_03125, partial [Xanthobacteraceae bacterium]
PAEQKPGEELYLTRIDEQIDQRTANREGRQARSGPQCGGVKVLRNVSALDTEGITDQSRNEDEESSRGEDIDRDRSISPSHDFETEMFKCHFYGRQRAQDTLAFI